MVSKVTTISFVLVLLFTVSVYSYTTVEHKNGQEILSKLQDGSNNVYIVMFYLWKQDEFITQ